LLEKVKFGILRHTILMKRPLLHQFALFCVTISGFFCAAPLAQANTFTTPAQFNYPGLTFSNPLTYTRPPVSQPTTFINFSSQHHKLLLAKSKTKQPLESIVLTPTLSVLTKASDNTAPQPTPTIYLQPTGNDIPTSTPTPSPSSQPTEEPTTPPSVTPNYSPAPQSNPGGLNAEVLFGMVNSYRASIGLPAFQEDAKTCTLAQTRAPEVAGEVASGNMHAGLEAMDLNYWNTENIISMNSEQAAFNWWQNDPIHHAAIVSHNIYSCVACSGNSCAEEFTSYVAK